MKFSVIIPALNEEKYIGKAIAALKKQKVDGDFEIIVADNNSKDNTIAAAKKAGADKVVVEKKKKAVAAKQPSLNTPSNANYTDIATQLLRDLDKTASPLAPTPKQIVRKGGKKQH